MIYATLYTGSSDTCSVDIITSLGHITRQLHSFAQNITSGIA